MEWSIQDTKCSLYKLFSSSGRVISALELQSSGLGFVLISFRVGHGGGGGGVVVYQYTRKKFAKIPKNTQNYTQVYFIPEIQRK